MTDYVRKSAVGGGRDRRGMEGAGRRRVVKQWARQHGLGLGHGGLPAATVRVAQEPRGRTVAILVAFGRVRAAVPMSVRDTLLDRLGDPYEVAAAVQAAVQDISAAAPRLLAEHPHLAARRLWCAERQQRLREALEALHSPAAGVPLHP
ncbi:hypothetical protein CHLRE_05g237283v5 [Chlamydomonas reinhardtii]|uniref:GED domain-containing protein n=1 Tax=Chlamydomonas reinhardtii TaxID=3055 RepID=A0A2K3DSW4_CHLRE|nr:uncharacterized protein CHLRE_05g237283v5 [Chlamydomonas reinhardtii]PNW83624.1 hypothetical protein CHLRE_05g237283v5 [Chlamydomonas reinhardtii]